MDTSVSMFYVGGHVTNVLYPSHYVTISSGSTQEAVKYLILQLPLFQFFYISTQILSPIFFLICLQGEYFISLVVPHLFSYLLESPHNFEPLNFACLVSTGYNPSKFSGHSFCHGMASLAMVMGFNNHKIQQLGRWCSNSYKLYITACRPGCSPYHPAYIGPFHMVSLMSLHLSTFCHCWLEHVPIRGV